MTENSKEKKAARERAKLEGISYTHALRLNRQGAPVASVRGRRSHTPTADTATLDRLLSADLEERMEEAQLVADMVLKHTGQQFSRLHMMRILACAEIAGVIEPYESVEEGE